MWIRLALKLRLLYCTSQSGGEEKVGAVFLD